MFVRESIFQIWQTHCHSILETSGHADEAWIANCINLLFDLLGFALFAIIWGSIVCFYGPEAFPLQDEICYYHYIAFCNLQHIHALQQHIYSQHC